MNTSGSAPALAGGGCRLPQHCPKEVRGYQFGENCGKQSNVGKDGTMARPEILIPKVVALNPSAGNICFLVKYLIQINLEIFLPRTIDKCTRGRCKRY